jgi:hypothetical protein
MRKKLIQFLDSNLFVDHIVSCVMFVVVFALTLLFSGMVDNIIAKIIIIDGSLMIVLMVWVDQ